MIARGGYIPLTVPLCREPFFYRAFTAFLPFLFYPGFYRVLFGFFLLFMVDLS